MSLSKGKPCIGNPTTVLHWATPRLSFDVLTLTSSPLISIVDRAGSISGGKPYNGNPTAGMS